VYIFDADSGLRCDGPFVLRYDYLWWAVLCALAYVVGIPVALATELGAAPVRGVLRFLARGTHDALLDARRQPAAVAPMFVAAAALCSAAVFAAMCLYTLAWAIARVISGALRGAARIAMHLLRPDTIARERAALREVLRATAAASASPHAAFAAVRFACCVEVGPFGGTESKNGPAGRGEQPTSFLVLALGRDYAPQAWFWECVIMGRKLLITLPQLFSSGHVEFEAVCVVLVLVLATCLQVAFNPYKSAALNRLESVALGGATVVVLCGLLFQARNFPSSPGLPPTQVVIAYICVAVMIGVVSLFGCMVLHISCTPQ
jgi:hypothetical protein